MPKKTDASHIAISTTAYSKAYLVPAWRSRAQLKEYERYGFAQFVYITLCAHVEGILADLITARLRSVRLFVPWDRLPPATGTEQGHRKSYELRPLLESV